MRGWAALVVVAALVGAVAWVAVEALALALAPCHTDSECARRFGGDGGPEGRAR